MGKSTVASMFVELGVPVLDADQAVSAFYAGDGAKAVEAVFPGVMVSGQVDRERLGSRVLGDPEALKRLEGLVHPGVAQARVHFIERAAASGRRLVIIDVPLLFETGGEASVDLVIVVSAPASIQRARALARMGVTEAAMALGPRLDLRQTQTLVMTPQLRQAIKLLQYSNVEVASFVRRGAGTQSAARAR